MRAGRLLRLAGRELRRSARHFALASVGVIVGVAAFSFFMALGLGVRDVVLKEVFAMDELEVVPRRLNVDVGPLNLDVSRDVLDDDAATRLAAIDGVGAVFPKMKLLAPAVGGGGYALLGQDIEMELAIDGIAPQLVEADIGKGFRFGDLGSYPAQGDRCDLRTPCARGGWCKAGACTEMVPVLVSHHLIEVYNGSLSRVHSLPKLSSTALNGFTFEIVVGDSMVPSAVREQRKSVRAVVVGISRKALPLGITVPLSQVRLLNAQFEGESAAAGYHSIVVQAEHQNRVGDVAAGIVDLGYDVSDGGAERAAMLIAVFMLVFALVAGVIVFISAVNVMHVLLMLVAQRKRELGVFRALGATRVDVRRLILVEAGALGLIAGSLGLVFSIAGAWLFDLLSVRYLPDFPYKPETYFDYPAWLLLGSLAFAVVFCCLGALSPAIRASRLDPARVLSTR